MVFQVSDAESVTLVFPQLKQEILAGFEVLLASIWVN